MPAIFLTFRTHLNRLEVSKQARFLLGLLNSFGLSVGSFMLFRLCSSVVLGSLLLLPAAAQTIRFDTNVGTFDMELNPTGNPNLQGHTDNIIAYVESGRYDLMVINRNNEVTPGGDADFVLQMGGLQMPDSLELPPAFTDFPSVPSFAPVVTDENNDGSIDFDIPGLTNSRGTVSLALSGAGPNSGTSSFFINLDDIPSLDPGGSIGEFVPFARIVDMATLDLIQGLQTASLAGGGVGSSNIPILDDDFLVFVERAFLLETTPEVPTALLGNEGASLATSLFSAPTPSPQALSVPEPSALALAFAAIMAISVMKPSRNR